MNTRAEITLNFDQKIGLLEVDIANVHWIEPSTFDYQIDQIEIILQRHKDLTIVFRTQSHANDSMKFMFRVMKMIERYQWLEGNDVKLHWIERSAVGARKTLKDKVRNCFLPAMEPATTNSYGIYAMS